MTSTRELAKCVGFDVGIEDHGCPYMLGHFEYEGGGQGLAYSIDMAFVMRFLDVFRVDSMAKVNGRSCWVTHTHDKITLIEPLFSKDGTPFDVLAWCEWARENNNLSPYEMRTGKKPGADR